MKNDYRDLMETVSVPEGLENRVLAAARRKQTERERPQKRRSPWLKRAACAACALALLLGTVTWRSAGDGAPALSCSFGLTAYAAETGEALRPNANGGLAFAASSGVAGDEIGHYTGCLFQVQGENIRTLTLSVDRGGLYRSETRTGLTKEQVRQLRQAEEAGGSVCSVYGEDEDGPMNAEVMTVLGAVVTEDYDPNARYGFWVPPEEMVTVTDPDADPRQEAHANIDTFDGARLTVAVTFADGTEREKTYILSTGRLRAEYGADGVLSLLPQLAGDDEPCVYGVYVADEGGSRWLQWPVDGSRTVSLSNPYGQRQTSVEQPTPEDPEQLRTTFHSGIDIPAEPGTPVLAAADGTVTETDFDPELGNYLILDHGGGLETVYACCRNVDVKKGDTVRAGEMVAAVGSTGQSTGPHLHFGVRQDGQAQNPVAYFDRAVRDTLRAE